MGVAVIVFTLLALRYKYVGEEEPQGEKPDSTEIKHVTDSNQMEHIDVGKRKVSSSSSEEELNETNANEANL